VVEAEIEDFFELTTLEEETTELFLAVELTLVAADEAFVVDEFAIDADSLTDDAEFETKTDVFFVVALESVMEDFFCRE